jgi:transcriptional regulator with XRE-family HTH domain
MAKDDSDPLDDGDTLDRAIGLRLRAAREQRRITREQAAKHLSISLDNYSKVEKGELRLRPGALVDCARLLGIAIVDLFTDLPQLNEQRRQVKPAQPRDNVVAFPSLKRKNAS